MSAALARLARPWRGGRALLLAGLTVTALAMPRAAAQPLPDKPFAEHHIVLQLSDRAADKQALVLSVAYNLLKVDPDKIAIVVVAFGPGIDLLRAESPNRALVDSLITQGVEFDVCMNTVETVERETERNVSLNPKAVPVQVGVGRVLELTEKGYTLVRP